MLKPVNRVFEETFQPYHHGKLEMNIPQTISRISTVDSYLVVDSSVGEEL